MLRPLCILLALATLAARGPAQEPAAPLHHGLRARLDPERHALELVDAIRIDAAAQLATGPQGGPRFTLHGALDAECLDDAWALVELEPAAAPAGDVMHPREYELLPGPAADRTRVTLAISGSIHHGLEVDGEEYARGFSATAGTIGPDGVYLGGASHWVPDFDGAMCTFDLDVELPPGWDAVSQGRRVDHARGGDGTRVRWECPHPMEEIYLIANRFVESSRAVAGIEAQVFLREDDPNLAAKYLEATGQYVAMYRSLLGPYPFAKFALVENFWETGYGMPSFTLLGPSVIRFPFILHSSYPHEILHNWWGNSVYVEHESGNWCEGLTAYLADHLIKEGQGQGVEYRRDTLKKYRDHVRTGRDFPLSEFRSRHSSATEAVGYGKALMVFHMLRRELGDEAFAAGLRRLYAEQRWQRASWDDLAGVFSAVAGRPLDAFFAQWVEREGAPQLELVVETGGPHRVVVHVRQTQEAEPYRVRVPVAITLAGSQQARVEVLELTERFQAFSFELPEQAVRVDLDPEFDVFRRLDREELPPTLGELFGAQALTIVVPAAQAEAWRELAQGWARGREDVRVIDDAQLEALPLDRSVWVLGADNALAPAVAGALPGARLDEAREGFSFVYAARHPADPDRSVGWVATSVPAAIPGLARKLPHYGKYSYLGFSGDEPTNVDKGQWAARRSPLVVFPEQPRASLPAREPLARPAPVFDPERMLGHVAFLAADELEGRGAGSEGLARAAQHVADAYRDAGLQPGGDDGGWFQVWTEPDGPDGRPVTLRNVVGVLPGTRAEWARQSVVLGAHLDHLGRGWPDVRAGNAGQVHNGADDNASGVAVLIETARALADQLEPARSLVFIAFDGEEMGLRGARHYVAAEGRYPATDALAMVNLDAVGRLSEGGLTVLGCGTADEWPHVARGVGFTTGVSSTCVADDPGGSDQVAFHEVGVPAVQLFTGAHADYHRPSDDVEHVDTAGLVQVATWVRETMIYLSEREEPFRSRLAGASAPAPASGGERRVSLGTVPAFDHAGPGVGIDSVIEGSPAERAGLAGGDLLLAIDGEELADLRAYSEVLKRHAPGDVILLRVRRGEEELELEATLVAR